MVDRFCLCACDCKRKLITISSLSIGHCTDCRVGHCRGNTLITKERLQIRRDEIDFQSYID